MLTYNKDMIFLQSAEKQFIQLERGKVYTVVLTHLQNNSTVVFANYKVGRLLNFNPENQSLTFDHSSKLESNILKLMIGEIDIIISGGKVIYVNYDKAYMVAKLNKIVWATVDSAELIKYQHKFSLVGDDANATGS